MISTLLELVGFGLVAVSVFLLSGLAICLAVAGAQCVFVGYCLDGYRMDWSRFYTVVKRSRRTKRTS